MSDSHDVDHAELISRAIENRLADLWTSKPASVHTYDPATRTADLIPGVLEPVISVSTGEITDVEIPIIPSIPVAFFAVGADYSFTTPIPKGTTGFYIVLTLSAAQWRAGPADGAKAQPAGDTRRHSIGNGFFFPMWRPDTGTIPGTEIAAMIFRAPEIRLLAETAARALAYADVTNARLDAIELWANAHKHAAPADAGLPALVPGGGDVSVPGIKVP